MHASRLLLPILVVVAAAAAATVADDEQAVPLPCVPQERDALLAFKRGITGDPNAVLDSWRPQDDCCRWRGVRCSDLTGRVAELNLRNDVHAGRSAAGDELAATALAGEIGPSLLSLEHLRRLDLSMNKLVGPSGRIPEFLGDLKNLRYLNLSHTPFSGRVPPQLGSLSKLQYLDLSRSNLTGQVPPEISMLTSLKYLDLSYNGLDGLITEEHFDGLRSLEYVDLSHNSLKIVVGSDWTPPFRLQQANFASCQMGPLFPSWLKSQVNMVQLNISSTGIMDRLPDWFSDAFWKVLRLDMSNNQISKLPANMETMSLEYLYASLNMFTGQIPPLPRNLTELDISKNLLSGPLPSNFGPPKLRKLNLINNSISGQLPVSMCELTLYGLDLSRNRFEGELPQCWKMADMVYLILCHNSFHGKFPPFLQRARNLKFLDLARNRFSGTLPMWIGNLGALRFLRLSYNMFEGHISNNITSLAKLYHLNLSNNRFSGAIPHLSSLIAMTKKYVAPSTAPAWYRDVISALLMVTKRTELIYQGNGIFQILNIDLSSNYLTGEIPEEITALKGLVNLNLSSNQLNGKIPFDIGVMQQLESLDLSKNNLSGEIPLSLSNLTSLSILDLSYNDLTGRIPSGSQLDTIYSQNQLIYDGNSGLCGPPLPTKCPGNAVSKNHDDPESDGHESGTMFFHYGLGFGMVAGIWVVFCVLLFNKARRIAYFRYFDKACDKIYVSVVVTWCQFARKIKS